MNEALAAVADLVRRETGITIAPSRQAALLGAIDRAAPGLGANAFAQVAKDPARRRDLVDRLIDEVTVQETAFMRDVDQLDLIAWHSLASGAKEAGAKKASAQQSRSGLVRVWSAACASGEEAYTLALLATEAFAPAPPPVEILGTDVSRAALAAATVGRYRERSVRALGPELRQRYFDRQPDGSYVVTGELRRLVRFRRHNLVRDPVPPLGEGSFDVVVCRNVLIYFAAAIAESVAGKLERSLSPNGIIVLGATDALARAGGMPEARPERPASLGTGAGRAGSADPMRSMGPTGSAGSARAGPAGSARAGSARLGSAGPGSASPAWRAGSAGPAGWAGPAGSVGSAGHVEDVGRSKDAAQPTGPAPATTRAERLTAAVRAADQGDRNAALDQVMILISQDPLDAEAQFIHGLVALEAGEPAVAAGALRRALYADSRFAVAAFALGRAYDALSDFAAARRAYEQALRTLDPDDDRHEVLLQQIQMTDIAAACRIRLGGPA